MNKRLLMLLALLAGGCAQLQLAYNPAAALVVSLPLAQAGVRDGRRQFAAEFAQELRRSGAEPNPWHWLHEPTSSAMSSAQTAPTPSGFPASASADARHVSVLIIPGIFGDCVDDQSLPFSDGVSRPVPANYTQGYGQHAALGLGSLRAVRVSGRASSRANARRVQRELEAEAARPEIATIVLVAYSKGVPDTLEALEALRAQQRLPAKLQALVSVSGVVLGTPIADQLHGLYAALAPGVAPLGCPTSDGDEVDSLTHAHRLQWLAAHPLPASVQLFTVVAHDTAEATAPGLRTFRKQLSRVDPRNDGQVIAGWSVLPGSTLLAEVRSDHWRYVLALEHHQRAVVRGLASTRGFPREAFFAATIRTVLASVALPSMVAPAERKP